MGTVICDYRKYSNSTIQTVCKQMGRRGGRLRRKKQIKAQIRANGTAVSSLQKYLSLIFVQVSVKQTTEFYSDFLWCNYGCIFKTSKILLLSIVFFFLIPNLKCFIRLLQLRINQFTFPMHTMSFVLLIEDRKAFIVLLNIHSNSQLTAFRYHLEMLQLLKQTLFGKPKIEEIDLNSTDLYFSMSILP